MVMTNSLRLALVCVALSACAPRLYVEETAAPFPEAMANLQASIASNGYTLSRVQRVDYGLNKRGYQTEKYRVVFFGKPEEIEKLSGDFPQLAPFLPLKITIREKEDTVEMVAINPQRLTRLYPDAELQPTFKRWHKDVRKILDDAARQL